MHYVAVSALSHDGLVRDQNEDSLVVGPWTVCAATTLTPQTFYLPVSDPVVVAVADGLGGHPAGEEASSLAVRWLARLAPTLTSEAAIREALGLCNEMVHAEAAVHPERTAMGTTIAGIVVSEQGVMVFNVGDSRVYVIDEAGLAQVSVDDNQPASVGERRSPVVTQTLGGRIESAPVEPHIGSRQLDTSARFLVCSDGLTDAVDNTAIDAILREHQGGKAVFELWKATIAAGAPDNVTVALVELATSPDG